MNMDILNIQQGDFEIYDYRLGEGANNTIDIIQIVSSLANDIYVQQVGDLI